MLPHEVPDFSSVKILVVGDVMLDRYWSGSTQRISPEAPVPVVKVHEDQECRAGGAGNVAYNLAVLGCQVKLFGVVGQDEPGEQLEAALIAVGVECHLVKSPIVRTISKLRVISQQQQLIRLDFEDSLSKVDSKELELAFSTCLEDTDILVLSDYAKGTLKNAQDLITKARSQDVPVIIDPKTKDFSVYQGATVVTPNLAEFEMVAGKCLSQNDLELKAKRACQDFELDALLVTQGEHGMTLVERAGSVNQLPVKATEVFDVTGAGDTVISVLSAVLGASGTLREAAALANLAAGIVVGKFGTAAISSDELKMNLHSYSQFMHQVVCDTELTGIVGRLKQVGKRIVMTNGCFDILHSGHVTYLEQAKRLGDILIVAVNDDASVSRLKGSSRPLNGLKERMFMLAALESVDWVVAFPEDTPERLIRQICPDVLVKGGDYTISEVVGADCVQAHGGEVYVLDFVPNYSTTALIEKIKDNSTKEEYV